MKQIIVNGTVLYEVRPGVYESAGPGVILREHNTGEIIKARRQELKMTQQNLADKMGVNIGTVSRYESGKIESITYEREKQFADALNCTIDYLDAFVDDPHESLRSPEYDGQTKRVIAYFNLLTQEQKAAVEAIMKSMVQEE